MWSSDQAASFEQKISEKVAEILRQEYKGIPSPVKKISRKTGIATTTIKKWYSGQNPPRLVHFLILARHYRAILQLLLEAIGGSHLWEAYDLLGDRLKTAPDHVKSTLPENIYSAENCTINICLPLRIASMLNQRQIWFLGQLKDGDRTNVDNIVTHWEVSLRTAKSDIAEIVRMKLIRFVGARKTGWYETMP